MKLTLIRPCMGAKERRYQEQRMEPLQLAVLATLTPPDVEISLFDERLEQIRFETPTDLVAITVESFTARRAYEIADEYRSRGVPVILGGLHPTLVPEEAALHANSVYTGDAEELWGQVIDDIRQGRLQPRYNARRGCFPTGFVTDRTLFRGKKYLPISLVQFGRGCPFNCTFCVTGAIFGGTHEYRRIADVIDELGALDRKRFVILVDDNLVTQPKQAKEFFRLLKPLRLRWAAQVSANVAHDPELLELMATAGCYGFLVGFESLYTDNLRSMKKNQNLISFDRYHRHIELFRQFGFMIWAAFTLGHDGDTPARIEETTEFAIENRFAFAAFNILMPYPGTRLYASLAEEGRLLYDGAWWLHPDYRFNYAAFRPKNMTPDELTAAVFRAEEKFYRYSAIFRRGFDFRTNMGSLAKSLIYFPYNVMFRKTVYEIHGMRFGANSRGDKAHGHLLADSPSARSDWR